MLDGWSSQLSHLRSYIFVCLKLTVSRSATARQRGERLFHHEHHQKDRKQQDSQQRVEGKEPQKKESEMDKFKDYMKEDDELGEEGKEHGGLM